MSDPDDKTYICLIGPHRSGKSTIGRFLMEERGMVRAHPFNPGRAASLAWLGVNGFSDADAEAMTDGALKDAPCGRLPKGGDGAPSSMRRLMDVLGAFTGNDLGPAWTIDLDVRMRERIDRAARLDVSGMSAPEAMTAATLMFCGASGEDARVAVLTGDPVCDVLMPEKVAKFPGAPVTVKALKDAFSDMFAAYDGMSGWDVTNGPGGVIEPLRLVPPACPDFPGYVLESCVYEIAHIRDTRSDVVVIRVVPEGAARDAAHEDPYASAAVGGIEADLTFVNPMVSKEDTWRRFSDLLDAHDIMPGKVSGPEPV